MPGGSVFISYRREDAAGEAGRLSDHLTRRFGPHRVFMDIDAIAPGTDFVVELDQALSRTAVVLVVIGRNWLTSANADGSRRLDESHDFVRREILTALQRGTRVVPVLVQNAAMPSAADLPADLAPLATRQASAIQHDEFSADAQRLADAIAPLVEEDVPARDAWRTRALIGASVLVVVLALAVWRWYGAADATDASERAGGASATDAATDSADGADALQARQQQVDDLVRIAEGQLQRQLDEAMTTLDRAVALDPDGTRARTLQEDVAMQWIREVSTSEGQTFADAMATPLAVLDRAAPFATGARAGDLVAHLGWATFLRRRDGDGRQDPEPVYRRAIAADPANPFANAMLGHWLLWKGTDEAALEQARPHFRIAADAGRATDVVRSLQFAALRNDRSVASRLEAIRVLDEMRRRGEPLRPGDARDVWSTYYFALGDRGEVTTTALLAALPPSEHLLTLQWAFDGVTKEDTAKRQQYRYYTARLQAAAGRTAEAREILRALQAEFGPDGAGTLPDAVRRALQ